MKKILTVFTATYNRAYILPKLYRSLCEQTNQNFKWLIIDDGSNDVTSVLVSEWIKEGTIEIEYHYQKNAGKMAAYNAAVNYTNTLLFMCVDSDDYLVSDAVETILFSADELENQKKVAGIVAYKGNEDGDVLVNEFTGNLVFSSLKGLYEKGFKGETTLVFKSKIAKEYLFPILPGEKFISEMYVYNQIDEKYDLKILRKVLTICEYLDDGYTKNGYNLVKKNPMGWAIIYHQKKKYTKRVIERIKYSAFAYSYVLMASKAARREAYKNGLYQKKLLDVIIFPISVALFLRRKWVHRNE